MIRSKGVAIERAVDFISIFETLVSQTRCHVVSSFSALPFGVIKMSLASRMNTKKL